MVSVITLSWKIFFNSLKQEQLTVACILRKNTKFYKILSQDRQKSRVKHICPLIHLDEHISKLDTSFCRHKISLFKIVIFSFRLEQTHHVWGFLRQLNDLSINFRRIFDVFSISSRLLVETTKILSVLLDFRSNLIRSLLKRSTSPKQLIVTCEKKLYFLWKFQILRL